MRGFNMVKHHGEIVVKHYCLIVWWFQNVSNMLLVSIPTNGVVHQGKNSKTFILGIIYIII